MSSKDPNSKENVPSIEEHYRLLLENIKDYAIFSLDLEGRVTSWNTGAERILGYTEEEIDLRVLRRRRRGPRAH